MHNKLIELKVMEIADVISMTNYSNIGLYDGLVGMLMFISYYQKYFEDDKYVEVKNMLLDKSCEGVCNGSYYTPYCSGISGVLYGLTCLNKHRLIDVDLMSVHDGYLNHLALSLEQYSQIRNYDFMHGATGIALYLLKNGSPLDIEIVLDYVNNLNITAEKNAGIVKWISKINQEKKSSYNIALSHGMSSISIFLSQCVKKNIKPQISKTLLNGTINFILEQEIDFKKYGSCFPYYSIEIDIDDIIKSRMAWCYGDLGVASAIWQAGKTLHNQQWKDKAIEVFRYATTRTNLESNLVRDAGICHGTAGIAQIFKRMYLETDIEDFKVANEYWINETLKMAKFEDGAAGYKAYHLNEQSVEWKSDFSFLEGIAGIGLSLISYLSDNLEDSAWDEVLLLS